MPQGGLLPAEEMPAASKAEQTTQTATAPEATAVHTRYTFTGKGSWFTASNWENERMPPAALKPGEQVIIDGSGSCLYGQATPFTIGKGSSVEVKAGKTLYISIGDYFIQKGGTLTNNGAITVVSGTLWAGEGPEGKTVNNGNINSTKLSVVDARIKQAPAPVQAIPFSTVKQKQ
jgi:hypothetical protein